MLTTPLLPSSRIAPLPGTHFLMQITEVQLLLKKLKPDNPPPPTSHNVSLHRSQATNFVISHKKLRTTHAYHNGVLSYDFPELLQRRCGQIIILPSCSVGCEKTSLGTLPVNPFLNKPIIAQSKILFMLTVLVPRFRGERKEEQAWPQLDIRISI
ncbi:hypothetical protein K443DRAFT_347782 [Laccaria amethystina LaAM-08-1]|uniref:Uncharacterized protein n=1 Tax=Laccaria amethystina LaAM-08-1 TaxID=1095629 RepID=A0A0C9XFC8_9AGAR|nr:hypothetical protein K443DRAFT_347782 [Laccaria amethystina LaAM-08-1]